jgi:hypothetical protein
MHRFSEQKYTSMVWGRKNTGLNCETSGSMHFRWLKSNLNAACPLHTCRKEEAKKMERQQELKELQSQHNVHTLTLKITSSVDYFIHVYTYFTTCNLIRFLYAEYIT